MREADGGEQRQGAQPDDSRTVSVDAGADGHPHGEAADHADADDPAQMPFGSAEHGNEIGVAEQHRQRRAEQNVRDISQPERPAIAERPSQAGVFRLRNAAIGENRDR